MPRHPPPATPTSLIARLAAYKCWNTAITVRLVSCFCSKHSPLNPNAVLVGIIARLALWPSAYRWIFHSPPEANRDHFDSKANLRLLMVFLFDLERSPLEISLERLILQSHVGFILGALFKILLYESLDYDNPGLKPGFFLPMTTALKSVIMFALDLLADVCESPKRMQPDTEVQAQCDPFTCFDMVGATLPIDIIQGALESEIPCQYPYTLDEVVIDGFFYSLVAPYPLSQAPSLYFDMSPSLNGDSDIDIPVALDNLRYNLSRRSEAHNKSRIFGGAYSKPSSYPEKADSNFDGALFEIHASSADPTPSTTSSIPSLPLYPPGAFYAPSDRDIELPASDDPPSPVAETSGCDTSIHPPGAFDSVTIKQPPTATEPLPEADHTGLSLYPPGAFHSSDNIDLPASIIEVYSEADETGPSLHPPGAFNSSDVIGRSPMNIELQEDETGSCDESVEAGDSSYDGDGSLSDSDGHLSIGDSEEPFACEIQEIPGRPGILEQGQATSRALYLEPQDDYLTDSDEHDPGPLMTEGARLEEMYGYLRSLLTIEPNSDGLNCDDNGDGRALPDILVYVEPRRPTLGPSIVPPSLPGSEKGSDSIPVAGQSGLALADKVDAALITPRDVAGEIPSTDRSMDTMQSTITATYDQDAISSLEDPLVNQNTLETSEGSPKTIRTPQDVEGYRAGGYLRLHDLTASVQDSPAPSYKTSTKDDHAAIPSSPKLAPSTSISFADPSPWGTAPATRGVRRLSMTSPRVLLRKGASFYELHRGPDKGLRSIANRQTNVNPHHPMVGHHGLHRALSTPSFNGRPE